jgi:AcrR family transcriptional regulator
MPKLSEQATEQRQRHILNAATRCFSRLGYHTTTMRHILAEAALSAGAVYNYYPSKDAILLVLAERDLQRSQHAIDQLTQQDDSAVEQLVAILIADLRRIDLLGQAKMKVCITAEQAINSDLDNKLRPLQVGQYEAVRKLLERQLGKAAEDAATSAKLLSMVYFGAVQTLATDQTIDYELLQQQLVRLLQA